MLFFLDGNLNIVYCFNFFNNCFNFYLRNFFEGEFVLSVFRLKTLFSLYYYKSNLCTRILITLRFPVLNLRNLKFTTQAPLTKDSAYKHLIKNPL